MTNFELKQAALDYVKQGFSIIPIGLNKKPLIKWKDYQSIKASSHDVEKWFNQYDVSGIAIVTGKISNLFVVDTEAEAEAEISQLEFGNTVIAKSGGGGRHFYYRYPAFPLDNKTGIMPFIDIRAESGYIIVPPSNHPSGGKYAWIEPLREDKLAECPSWLVPYLKDEKHEPLDGLIPEGKRNDGAAKYLGKLLKEHEPEEWGTIAWSTFLLWNKQNCNPPLEEKELKTIFDSITSRELKKESRDDKLFSLIEKEAILLFHDQYNEAYARITINNSPRIYKCGSGDFKNYLYLLFQKNYGRMTNSQNVNNVVSTLEAKAKLEGGRFYLSNRVKSENEVIFYDLSDTAGQIIRIEPNKWEVITPTSPVFRRYSHQLEQKVGNESCTLDKLFSFIKVKTEEEKMLLLVWLIACFIPDIPHPVIVLYGHHGAAKTTASKLLRKLLDPSMLETLALPRSNDELVQQLAHHYAPAYDNIDKLPDGISDVLCRAVTNEGISKRRLYSDDDDIIYTYRRCIILNGINLAAEKADLLDRSLIFELERISPNERLPEQELLQAFEKIRPNLFRSMLDILAKALFLHPQVVISSSPRMADFAKWGVAIAEAMNYRGEDFLQAYSRNIDRQNKEALDSNIVASSLVEFMNDRDSWQGTATELLDALEELNQRQKLKNKEWPKAANTLMRKINQISPNLEQTGITVKTDKSGAKRIIKIEKNIVPIVQSSINRLKTNDDIRTIDISTSSSISSFVLALRDEVNSIWDDRDDILCEKFRACHYMDGLIPIDCLEQTEALKVMQNVFGEDCQYIN